MLGFLVLTAIFFGCSGFNLMFGRYKKSFGAFFCAVAIVLASVSDFFLPTLARSRSPEAFASRALEASESHHLYFYKEVQYALAYYVGKDVPFVNSLDEIRQRDGAQKETLIFVRLDHLKDLGDDVNKLDVLLGGDVWRADGKHPIGLYKLED
jgi:hypothetical protein